VERLPLRFEDDPFNLPNRGPWLPGRWQGPTPKFRALHNSSLISQGDLNLGELTNTRVARAMYKKGDGTFGYAETLLTAPENQLVSNSDFSARSYGYDPVKSAPDFSTGGWYAAGGTSTINSEVQFTTTGTGGVGHATLLTDNYHYRVVATGTTTANEITVHNSPSGATDPIETIATGAFSVDFIFTAGVTDPANPEDLYFRNGSAGVTVFTTLTITRMTLSEANSRMTGTGSDVLDGDGDMSSDPTSDWGGTEATDSWGESSYLRYTFTTVNTNKGAYKGAALTPGQRYYITFKARTDRSCSGGFSSIGDNLYTGNEVSNPTLSSDWQDYAFYITPTGTDLRLYMEDGGSIGDTLDFDDVTIVPVEHDWEPATTGMVFDVDDTSAGKLYFVGDDSADGDKVKLTAVYTIGHYYRVSVKAKVVSGTPAPMRLGQVFASDNDYNFSFTPTTSEETYTGYIVCYDGNFYLGNNGTGLDGVVMEFDDLVVEEVTLDDYSVVGTLSADCYFKYLENDTVHAVRVGSAAVAYLQQDIGDADDWVQWSIVLSDVTGSMGVTTTGVSFGSFTASVSDQINQLKGAGIVAFFCAAGSNGIIESFTAYPVPQTQAFEDGWALFGAQAKNSALDSRGSAWEDSANWGESVGIVWGSASTGFDGTENAITIGDEADDASKSIWQGITVPDDSNTHTIAFFIKKEESIDSYPALVTYLNGGTTQLWGKFVVDPTDGTYATADNISFVAVQDYGDFWRYVATVTNNSTGNDDLTIYLLPARNVNIGSIGSTDNAATGSAVFDQVDVYLNTSGWIPNPIVTESSEVTQDADLARWEMSADFKKLFANEYGSNLILNGEFTTNTDNWIDGEDSVLTRVDLTSTPGSSAGGNDDYGIEVKVTNSNANARAHQNISGVAIGTTYRFTARVYSPSSNIQNTAGRLAFWNSDYSGGAIAYGSVEDEWETLTLYLTPTTSLVRLGLSVRGGNNDDVAYFDDVKFEPVTNLAQQTTVFKWKPGYDHNARDSGAPGIVSVRNSGVSLLYQGFSGGVGQIKSYDNTTIIQPNYAYSANTEYLVAVKSGYIVDNQLIYAVAIEPLSNTFDADSWKDSGLFDGGYILGIYLNLFYSGWGKIWMKDLLIFDEILDDVDINILGSV
jgi:hypothetical protein